jgi:hypothetical protein
MKIRIGLIIIILSLFLNSCNLQSPPSGWNSYISDGLISQDSFPIGWKHYLDTPSNMHDDPEINHVFRAWGQNTGGSGDAYQSIWRDYTVGRAKSFYNDLIKTQINYKKDPQQNHIEFKAPEDIKFVSEVADQSLLLCGWYITGYCDTFVRYRNYVVYFHAEVEMKYDDVISDGLTFQEMEALLQQLDSTFVEYLRNNSIIPPNR